MFFSESAEFESSVNSSMSNELMIEKNFPTDVDNVSVALTKVTYEIEIEFLFDNSNIFFHTVSS